MTFTIAVPKKRIAIRNERRERVCGFRRLAGPPFDRGARK